MKNEELRMKSDEFVKIDQMKNMKNLLFCVFQTVAVVVVLSGMASCQFDDQEDKYNYSTVVFVNQDYNRNLIVGEGLKMKVGVSLVGLVSNKEERIVQYKVDPSLLDEVEGKKILPPDCYTLGHPSQIVIPKGKMDGYLSVKIDSAKFLAAPEALTGEYVLPIRIESVPSVDTLIAGRDFIRISLSYFAKQFGNYHYSGEVDKYLGIVLFNSYFYDHNPNDNNSFRFLETVSPTTFRMVADPRNADDPAKDISFLIQVTTNGTEVTILPDPDSPTEVSATGNCTYDPRNRRFHLEYTWKDEEGADCYAVEDLTFRNRIYDDQGNQIYINEWR